MCSPGEGVTTLPGMECQGIWGNQDLCILDLQCFQSYKLGTGWNNKHLDPLAVPTSSRASAKEGYGARMRNVSSLLYPQCNYSLRLGAVDREPGSSGPQILRGRASGSHNRADRW